METRILTPEEWAKAYNSISVPELPYEGIPVRDLETLKQQDAKTAHQVAEEIFEELEKRLIPGTQLLHLTFTAEDWICLKARWLK